MQKTTPLGHRRYSRFTFVENTISKSPKFPRAKFLRSNWLFCFISMCKFGSFKNPFATITSQSELYFRIRRFILLVQMRKVFSMNYGSSTSSWKPWRWVRRNLLFSMRDIYISSNPWIISQMITNTVPISKRIVISYAMKWGIPFWIWWKVNGNWDNNMIRISWWRESHCRTNTSVGRNK